MECNANGSIVLYESSPLSDIFLPIKATARVKYTCFDISQKYLAFGATSGSVYIFKREPLHFLQAIVNKEGQLDVICIGPQENLLAIATSKGFVVLVEFTWEQSSFGFRRIFTSYDHRGSHVTYLKWSPNGSRLFVGDDKGKVTVITCTLAKAVPLLQPRTALVAKLESAVVQLDFACDKILISTLKWCYLCDTEREQYSSIGKKSREGEFGSCFYINPKLEHPLIYSARPGSRIWEVDFEGNVLCTHQLKKSLAQAPAQLILYNEPTRLVSNEIWAPQALNFKKLMVFGEDHLLACTTDSVFIFVPLEVVDLVIWCKMPQSIHDMKTHKRDIYLRYESGSMQRLQVLAVERCIRDLLDRGLWNDSARLCLNYQLPVINTRARRVLPYSMMQLLVARLDDEQLRTSIQCVVDKLQRSEREECMERTREGIYVVSRGQRKYDWEDDTERENNRKSPARKLWGGFRPVSPYRPAARLEEIRKMPDNTHVRRKSEDVDPSNAVVEFATAELSNGLPRSLSCGNWTLGTLEHEVVDVSSRSHVGNQGILFEEIRQSVSAKVSSGTSKILRTMGDIEDRLKGSLASAPIPELLDVDTGNVLTNKLDNNTSIDTENVVCVAPRSQSTGNASKPKNCTVVGSFEIPKINLSEFLVDTATAWKALAETEKQFDILETKETLSSWVRSLNRVQAECNRAILEQFSCETIEASTQENVMHFKVINSLSGFHWWKKSPEEDAEAANYRWIFLVDWMQLSPEIQTWVSRLVVACYGCGVLGEIGDDWKRGNRMFGKKLLVFGDGIVRIMDCETSGPSIWESCTPEEAEDEAETVFLAQYLYLASSESFHRCLAYRRHDVYRSWTILLDMPKENLDIVGEISEGVQALLRVLSERRCNLRHACKIAEPVSPRDVIYSLQRTQVARKTLLGVMEALWNRSAVKSMRWGLWNVKEVLELHPNFYSFWVRNLMQEDHSSPVDNLKCCNGWPKPLSNRHPWKWKSLLCCIFNDVKLGKLRESFIELCQQFGFWTGYLILLKRAGEREKLLETLFYLDDKELLENQRMGFVPESSDEWRFLLRITQTTNNEELDKRVMNVEEISKLMVKFLSVTQAIKILQEVEESPSASGLKLSYQFYIGCIMQQIARRECKSLVQSVLESTASHLWTKRTTVVSPQVVEEMYKESRGNASTGEIRNARFLEDLRCHWGISVDLAKNCAFCQQPLAKASSSRPYLGGVVIFICGHALHRLCSNDDICCLCLVQKRTGAPL